MFCSLRISAKVGKEVSIFSVSLTVIGFLETNPFDKLKLERIKELQEGAPEKEKDYIDFFEDLEKNFPDH